MERAIRVTQLSDTHFLEPGREPEGGFGYDIAEAFDAVLDHTQGNGETDLVVVTGDVADHARPDQYRLAADAFQRFPVPVNVCPGNHDLVAPLTVGIGRPAIATSRIIELGTWCFVFVDSSAGTMAEHESGRLVDPKDPGERLHSNGALGQREASWISEVCETTAAEHVFVWVHHPPEPPVKLAHSPPYAAEWETLLADLPIIRGLGAGHTHVPDDYSVSDRPVFVSPSLKTNFDLRARTWLPPGYRTYQFAPSGAVTSEVHLMDDPRWPRRRLGRTLMSLFNGEITFDELSEIIAERERAAQQG